MRLHAGIGYVTPNDEHQGRGPAIRKARQAGLEQALWVPVIRSKSCDLRILMDQPTESIPSHDPPNRHGDS